MHDHQPPATKRAKVFTRRDSFSPPPSLCRSFSNNSSFCTPSISTSTSASAGGSVVDAAPASQTPHAQHQPQPQHQPTPAHHGAGKALSGENGSTHSGVGGRLDAAATQLQHAIKEDIEKLEAVLDTLLEDDNDCSPSDCTDAYYCLNSYFEEDEQDVIVSHLVREHRDAFFEAVMLHLQARDRFLVEAAIQSLSYLLHHPGVIRCLPVSLQRDAILSLIRVIQTSVTESLSLPAAPAADTQEGEDMLAYKSRCAAAIWALSMQGVDASVLKATAGDMLLSLQQAGRRFASHTIDDVLMTCTTQLMRRLGTAWFRANIISLADICLPRLVSGSHKARQGCELMYFQCLRAAIAAASPRKRLRIFSQTAEPTAAGMLQAMRRSKADVQRVLKRWIDMVEVFGAVWRFPEARPSVNAYLRALQFAISVRSDSTSPNVRVNVWLAVTRLLLCFSHDPAVLLTNKRIALFTKILQRTHTHHPTEPLRAKLWCVFAVLVGQQLEKQFDVVAALLRHLKALHEKAEVAWFPRACEPVFELLLWLTRAGHTQDTASGQPSLPTLARQVLSLPDHEDIPEAVSSFDALLSQLQLALERPLSLNGTRCPVDPAKVAAWFGQQAHLLCWCINTAVRPRSPPTPLAGLSTPHPPPFPAWITRVMRLILCKRQKPRAPLHHAGGSDERVLQCVVEACMAHPSPNLACAVAILRYASPETLLFGKRVPVPPVPKATATATPRCQNSVSTAAAAAATVTTGHTRASVRPFPPPARPAHACARQQAGPSVAENRNGNNANNGGAEEEDDDDYDDMSPTQGPTASKTDSGSHCQLPARNGNGTVTHGFAGAESGSTLQFVSEPLLVGIVFTLLRHADFWRVCADKQDRAMLVEGTDDGLTMGGDDDGDLDGNATAAADGAGETQQQHSPSSAKCSREEGEAQGEDAREMAHEKEEGQEGQRCGRISAHTTTGAASDETSPEVWGRLGCSVDVDDVTLYSPPLIGKGNQGGGPERVQATTTAASAGPSTINPSPRSTSTSSSSSSSSSSPAEALQVRQELIAGAWRRALRVCFHSLNPLITVLGPVQLLEEFVRARVESGAGASVWPWAELVQQLTAFVGSGGQCFTGDHETPDLETVSRVLALPYTTGLVKHIPLSHSKRLSELWAEAYGEIAAACEAADLAPNLLCAHVLRRMKRSVLSHALNRRPATFEMTCACVSAALEHAVWTPKVTDMSSLSDLLLVVEHLLGLCCDIACDQNARVPLSPHCDTLLAGLGSLVRCMAKPKLLLVLLDKLGGVVSKFVRRVGRGRESRKAALRHGRQFVARHSPSRPKSSLAASPSLSTSPTRDASLKPLSHPFQAKLVSLCRDIGFALRQREPGAPGLTDMLRVATPLLEAGLVHEHADIQRAFVLAWNRVFRDVPAREIPDAVATVLRDLMRVWPGMVKTQLLSRASSSPVSPASAGRAHVLGPRLTDSASPSPSPPPSLSLRADELEDGEEAQQPGEEQATSDTLGASPSTSSSSARPSTSDTNDIKNADTTTTTTSSSSSSSFPGSGKRSPRRASTVNNDTSPARSAAAPMPDAPLSAFSLSSPAISSGSKGARSRMTAARVGAAPQTPKRRGRQKNSNSSGNSGSNSGIGALRFVGGDSADGTLDCGNGRAVSGNSLLARMQRGEELLAAASRAGTSPATGSGEQGRRIRQRGRSKASRALRFSRPIEEEDSELFVKVDGSKERAREQGELSDNAARGGNSGRRGRGGAGDDECGDAIAGGAAAPGVADVARMRVRRMSEWQRERRRERKEQLLSVRMYTSVDVSSQDSCSLLEPEPGSQTLVAANHADVLREVPVRVDEAEAETTVLSGEETELEGSDEGADKSSGGGGVGGDEALPTAAAYGTLLKGRPVGILKRRSVHDRALHEDGAAAARYRAENGRGRRRGVRFNLALNTQQVFVEGGGDGPDGAGAGDAAKNDGGPETDAASATKKQINPSGDGSNSERNENQLNRKRRHGEEACTSEGKARAGNRHCASPTKNPGDDTPLQKRRHTSSSDRHLSKHAKQSSPRMVLGGTPRAKRMLAAAAQQRQQQQ